MSKPININSKQVFTPLGLGGTWFSSWFDSPYYHLLYKDRNYREAQIFMDNLTQYLNMEEGAKVLDLACGKGRHAIYLNQLGYNVLGVDLSPNSIEIAKKNENENLKFAVHDMRLPFEEKFDGIFNLFTSFGYFEDENDNLKTLISIKESLSEYGFGVIDFMNVRKVIADLVPTEIKTVEGIDFHIKRYVLDNHICKEINFEDKGETYHFTEKVRALTLQDFELLMDQAGMNLLDTFGDYKLKKFHKTESDRLIMIFK
jgi:SAM-dependent methyltransferase